jgi:hypothetical protein
MIPRMVNLFDAQQLGSYWKRGNRPIGLSAVRATLRAGFPDDVTLCYASFWANFRTAYSSCKIIEFMQIEFFHQTGSCWLYPGAARNCATS